MTPSLFLCDCLTTVVHTRQQSLRLFSPCLDLYASLLVAKTMVTERERERE